jgi:hypothetical protein
MTPVRDDEADTHALFATDTAKAFVDQQQHLLKAREQGAKVATPA